LGPAIQSYTEKVLRFAPDEADLLTLPEAFHHGNTRNGS
jgi:hypothetical protein